MEAKTMTVTEAAKRLNVNPYTVTRWVRGGVLKGFKDNPEAKRRSPWRITIESVEILERKRRVQAGASNGTPPGSEVHNAKNRL